MKDMPTKMTAYEFRVHMETIRRNRQYPDCCQICADTKIILDSTPSGLTASDCPRCVVSRDTMTLTEI